VHLKTNFCRLMLYHRNYISLEKKRRKVKKAEYAASGVLSIHLLGWLGRGRYRDDQPGLHGGVEVLGDRPVAGAAVVVVPLPERRHALPPRPHLLHSQHKRERISLTRPSKQIKMRYHSRGLKGIAGWSLDGAARRGPLAMPTFMATELRA
jgi:hypothetical protein